MSGLSERPACYKVAVFMLFKSIALFITGFAVPWWAQNYSHDDGIINSHSGLWLGCTQDGCSAISGQPGVLGLISCLIYIVNTSPILKRSPELGYSWGFGLDLAGSILVVLVALIIAVSNSRKTTEDSDRRFYYYYDHHRSRGRLTDLDADGYGDDGVDDSARGHNGLSSRNRRGAEPPESTTEEASCPAAATPPPPYTPPLESSPRSAHPCRCHGRTWGGEAPNVDTLRQRSAGNHVQNHVTSQDVNRLETNCTIRTVRLYKIPVSSTGGEPRKPSAVCPPALGAAFPGLGEGPTSARCPRQCSSTRGMLCACPRFGGHSPVMLPTNMRGKHGSRCRMSDTSVSSAKNMTEYQQTDRTTVSPVALACRGEAGDSLEIAFLTRHGSAMGVVLMTRHPVYIAGVFSVFIATILFFIGSIVPAWIVSGDVGVGLWFARNDSGHIWSYNIKNDEEWVKTVKILQVIGMLFLVFSCCTAVFTECRFKPRPPSYFLESVVLIGGLVSLSGPMVYIGHTRHGVESSDFRYGWALSLNVAAACLAIVTAVVMFITNALTNSPRARGNHFGGYPLHDVRADSSQHLTIPDTWEDVNYARLSPSHLLQDGYHLGRDDFATWDSPSMSRGYLGHTMPYSPARDYGDVMGSPYSAYAPAYTIPRAVLRSGYHGYRNSNLEDDGL
ncbi:hypothetical protein C0Q70_02126 [Pomacea canaliculata]|uniref:Uncharacterized protein n=1 Tax=Pomacea canaliculata TaxID=400727 RepID=A0A2T7Q1E7_POMCA|nr:hypothetical protein C0Q70_02126 [Pomacea canaliculata]